MSSAEILVHNSNNETNNFENLEESPTTYQPSLDENVNLVYTPTSQKSDPKSSNDSPTIIASTSDCVSNQCEEAPIITEPVLRKAISDVQNDLLSSDWESHSPKKSQHKETEKKRLARMQQLARMEEKLRKMPEEPTKAPKTARVAEILTEIEEEIAQPKTASNKTTDPTELQTEKDAMQIDNQVSLETSPPSKTCDDAPSSKSPKKSKTRKSPRPEPPKQTDASTIDDASLIDQLLESRLIKIGEQFEFLEETGILLRDTWIDCTFTNEKFSSLQNWCQAVGRAKGLSNREMRSMSVLDTVKVRSKSLSELMGLKETTLPDSLPELTSEPDSGTPPELDTNTPPKKKRPQPSRDENSPRKLPFGTEEKKKESPRKKKQKKTQVSQVNSEEWICSRRKGTSEETSTSPSKSPKKKLFRAETLDFEITSPSKTRNTHITDYMSNVHPAPVVEVAPPPPSDADLMPPPSTGSLLFLYSRKSQLSPTQSKPAEKEVVEIDLETPNKLAKFNLKTEEEEEIEVPTPTPSKSSLKPQTTKSPVILGTGLKSSMLEHTRLLINKIGGSLVNSFTSLVTHVIVLPDKDNKTKRTVKYLNAVLSGAWILSYDWILESYRKGEWVEENVYEVSGDNIAVGAPKKARESKKSLFTDCKFFFSGDFATPSKEDLCFLVKTGHGTVLDSAPSPATTTEELLGTDTTFIIVDGKSISQESAQELYFKTGRPPIDYLWILDSVSMFEKKSIDEYRVIDVPEIVYETQNSLAF